MKMADMLPSTSYKLGRRTLQITRFGFGAAGLGQNYFRLTDDEARATVDAAWENGVRLYDTAPGYGLGLSEHRLGQALYRQPRDAFVLSTKVGRRLIAGYEGQAADRAGWLDPLPYGGLWDFTYDGIMRSFEDSLQRLRMDRIDLLYIHDLDDAHHKPDALAANFAALRTSGIRALENLRQSGAISGFGAGANFARDIAPMLDQFDLDVMLVASPYTLLHQEALADLNRCHERSVQVFVGAVFQSGLLATGYVPGAKYNYSDTTPAPVIEKLGALSELCLRHNVSLPAAALQFPLAHPAVAAVVPGAVRPAEVNANAAYFLESISGAFWSDLRKADLIRPDAPLPT